MFFKRLPAERSLEISLFTITLGLTCVLYCLPGYKMVVLNLFHLPVVLAAFYLGRHRAGILALVCVLLASAVAAMDLEGFAAANSPLVIGLAVTVWASVVGLNAIFVGTLSDERSRKLNELHDAYVGVVEVLAHYLKSADRMLETRSKRVSDLSQQVATQMRLSQKEIDDLRVAALLQDMENIEITAKVIRKAVGDLRKSNSQEEHTFQGSDLVQSLGSVLTGALPLILNHTDSMNFEFSDEDTGKVNDLPFGALIIRSVSDYDAFVHGQQEAGMTPQQAIQALRSDLDSEHHPAVIHALEQVVLRPETSESTRSSNREELLSVAAE
jgi:HD-GYP domain-containing protein (c-di-GMP phosphodiesterase class II)